MHENAKKGSQGIQENAGDLVVYDGVLHSGTPTVLWQNNIVLHLHAATSCRMAALCHNHGTYGCVMAQNLVAVFDNTQSCPAA